MSDPARIIDANANRAREGLRVLEDIARFHLDDPRLSEAFKTLRHGVVAAVEALPLTPADRLAARDTPQDVGTRISTESEHHRPTLDALAATAAARTSEALRVLEESAKLIASSGAPFESARYRLYDAERSLRLRLRTRVPQWRLCVLITESLCKLAWQDVVEASLAGGADCIQLREKQFGAGALLERARELIRLVDRRAHVVINDRADIALLAGADAVHIGKLDLPLPEVQRLVRSRIAIGCSASSLDRARQIVTQGADYVGLGAMFPTSTKDAPETVGPSLVADFVACAETRALPHLAIGGITPENMPAVVQAGARGVAVSSVVCSDSDPQRICRALLAYLNQAAHTPESQAPATTGGEQPHHPDPVSPPRGESRT